MLGKKIKHPNGEIHDTFLEKKKPFGLLYELELFLNYFIDLHHTILKK